MSQHTCTRSHLDFFVILSYILCLLEDTFSRLAVISPNAYHSGQTAQLIWLLVESPFTQFPTTEITMLCYCMIFFDGVAFQLLRIHAPGKVPRSTGRQVFPYKQPSVHWIVCNKPQLKWCTLADTGCEITGWGRGQGVWKASLEIM